MSIDSLRYPEERRLATVLFADVQGFTTLAEQLDFETVSDLLKGIWERLDKVVEINNGYIDKHLGDGIMAIWGAPFAGEHDAEQAVVAGLQLITALNEYSGSSGIRGAEKLKLRVGINTGQVFAGYVGTRREYTVLGDNVNVASRLEQTAEAGTVVIGENTLRMVRGRFKVRRLNPTIAKGKTELVQPYVVEDYLSTMGDSSMGQNVENLTIKLIGRREELNKLKFIHDRAFEPGIKPIMALINGDIGIGKTRLFMEFGNFIENEPISTSIITSRGFARSLKGPYSLWRVLFRNCFGIRDDDTGKTANEKWLKGLESVWRDESPDSRIDAAILLGEVAGLNEQDQISQEDNQQRIFKLTHQLLQHISAKKRLVLFLDDLQWVDRESLQLLTQLLVDNEQPLNIMIVGAARSEFLKNQSQWHNLARVINLNPLVLTPEMISTAYTPLRMVPDSILQEISLRADGNPYFLSEIIKNLLKGSLHNINVDPEEIHQQLVTQIPESLRASLQARMDNLSREARTAALFASVVGRVFWVGAILAAARSAPISGSTPLINVPETVIDRYIQSGLRQLVLADLAIPHSGSKFSNEQEYIFKNSYLCDVAYSLIPNRNRSQYHKAVAEWMGQMTDPVFQPMARDHEQKAESSAKIAMGDLSQTPSWKNDN